MKLLRMYQKVKIQKSVIMMRTLSVDESELWENLGDNDNIEVLTAIKDTSKERLACFQIFRNCESKNKF